MGKLTICVHKCDILHSSQYLNVNPRVIILVDNTYRFQTRIANNTHSPVYEETFLVGNTHHLAKIEVSVYHVLKTKVIDINSVLSTLRIVNTIGLGGGGGVAASKGVNGGPTDQLAHPNAESAGGGGGGGTNGGGVSGGSVLLGHCYLSTQRLTKGQPKTRSYVLGTSPKKNDAIWIEDPEGVAGAISITLHSDSLGESPGVLQINEELENTYISRLKRLLLRCEPRKIPVMDIILSNVRDPSELGAGMMAIKPRAQSSTPGGARYLSFSGSTAARVNEKENPSFSLVHPDEYESFKGLMARLCREYHEEEPEELTVSVSVSGCSHLDRSVMDKPLARATRLHVILRTSSQEFVTEEVKFHGTISWPMNAVLFDIVDPDSFTIFVIVVGRSGNKFYEMGRTKLGLFGLRHERVSTRNMFLCSFSGSNPRAVVGRAHIFLEPLNFGEATLETATRVDHYYDRLGNFLKHYDLMLLSKMDTLIRSRAGGLDDLMRDLIMLYGHEPNTARLHMTVKTVVALHENPTTELNKKRVLVIVTMGGASFRTKSREVQRFAETSFDEGHTFNVVRNTDFIRVDVVKASDESVVYGSVEFSCLNIQRCIPSARKLYLVGNAGKSDAFLSGIITITLYSGDLGNPYRMDEKLEDIYTGRLRRYAQRCFPESLHCVNLATASIFDMESFMGELSVTFKKEDATYAVFVTILGCRQLSSGFGGTNPYVVARLDIDSYSTKWIKDSTEPDFFEFTEFYTDRLNGKCITLIVMDHSEMGHDKEVGYVSLSLENVQLGQLYHDFEPLRPFTKSQKDSNLYSKKGHANHDHFAEDSSCSSILEKKRTIGLVGFRFTVINLECIDMTRVQVIRREHTQSRPNPTGFGVGDDSLLHLDRSSNSGRSLCSNDLALADAANTQRSIMAPGRLLRYVGLNLKMITRARKLVVRRSAELVEQLQRNVGLSNSSTLSNSVSAVSEAVTPRSLAKFPTYNIMDRFYASFGTHFMPENTMSKTFDSNLGDMEDSLQSVSKFSDIANTAQSDNSHMLLYVRVLFCKSLIQTSSRWLNPYVLLFTASKTYRTHMDFETSDPVYSDEFVFRVFDPKEDFLQIYVLTDTPYGVKQLGHCVLSLCNVQRDQSHTRRAALVVDAHTQNAFEQGFVSLLLMARNFGLQYLPSADAENRLREQIHGYLVHAVPSQLHWLEWLVGMYADLNKNSLVHLLGKHYFVNKSKQAAGVKVGIRTLSKMSSNGIYVSGNCAVKVKVGSRTYAKTRVAVGVDGHFQVDQTLDIKLENVETVILRIMVTLNGKIKGGECWLNMTDLHRGVVQERTHMLVQNVRGPNPVPCGLITISLLSNDFGSYSEPPCKEEEAVFNRLQRYLSYYKPCELINADIIFSSVFNPKAYMRKLIDTYGPEPGDFSLHVVVRRCLNLYFSNYGNNTVTDASPSRSRISINPFCVLRCGLDEYRTRICEGKAEWVFNESFNLHVGLPELEVVELIVFNFYASKSVEIGRTRVFIDKIKRGVVNSRKLLLVSNAGTKYAVVNGIVELDLFSNDIGVPTHRLRSRSSFTGSRQHLFLMPDSNSDRAERTARSYEAFPDTNDSFETRGVDRDRNFPLSPPTSPFNGHAGRGIGTEDVEHLDGAALLHDFPQHIDPATISNFNHAEGGSQISSDSSLYEEADIYQVPSFFSPTGDPSVSNGLSSTELKVARHESPTELTNRPVEVTIVGFTFANIKAVPVEGELYVRVMEGPTTVFRTSPMPLSKLVVLKRTFKVYNVVLHPDIILTLKVSVSGAFTNRALCYTDFCFNQCHKNVNLKNLRLYDTKYGFIGTCFLKIVVPDHLPPTWTPQDVTMQSLELITDDIASLGERYSPQSLQTLDITLSRALDIRRLHHTLRKKLAPDVLATVYVLVHSIEIKNYVFKHNCVVVASVGNYSAEVPQQLPVSHGGKQLSFFPYGMSRKETQTLLFCPIRVDISATELSIVMTLRVCDRLSKDNVVEVGQALVSLRALLTPRVYDTSEGVNVTLVRVHQGSNSMHTTPIGSVVFSLAPSAYERYSPPVCFPSTVARGFSRRYVRYYEKRISNFMQHYNVAELGSLHAHLYDTYVASGNWRDGLPEYLSELVERWGEEVNPPGPIPPLD